MSNLTILNTAVRQTNNLFNLKDLHLASGGEKKHEPYLFTRLETTQELIAEIKQQDPTTTPLKTLRGTQGGTFACEELVIAYAMWISPKFHLVVLRAFIAMHKGQSQNTQPNLPLAEPTYTRELTERQWLRFASLWFALYNNLELLGRVYKPLEALGSRYGVEAYTHWSEYQTTLGALQRLLVPMLAEFEADPMQDGHFHKALKTLREYKPHGLGAVVIV